MPHDPTNDSLMSRNAPVDMHAEDFRAAGHQLVDSIADFLGGIRDYPVTTAPAPSFLRQLLPQGEIPETGKPASELLAEATDLLLENSLFNGHPKFWGYITSSPTPIGMLADLLASAVNSNCGAYVLSPVATEVEKQTIQWLAELIGYPADCGGIMVSGGNMANFIGFLAARKAKAEWDIRKEGLAHINGKWRIYTSAETHTWIHKAADLFGLGTNAIRWIPVTEDLKMNTLVLAKTLADDREKGLVPFVIVGTAGSVSTGAVDDLEAIAALAEQFGCWFHVDGAYGAFAAALPESAALFKGFEKADSIAMDPHKWLYNPLEAGCTLVKKKEALPDAFSFHPVYYNFDDDAEQQTNFYEYGMQNSRGFRALKVWLSLRQAGAAGYRKMIREDISLAKRLYDIVSEETELEAYTYSLSITTFRYHPQDLPADSKTQEFLNRLNQELLNELQAGGKIFPSNAVIRGDYVLRFCIVNFRTAVSDIDSVPGLVKAVGRKLYERMKATS